jgi:hypothetical protein
VEFQQDSPIAVDDELVIEATGFPRLLARARKISRQRQGRVSIQFKQSLDRAARDRLIVKLYTGGYSQDIRQLDMPAIAGGIWKRAFGRVATEAESARLH